MIKISNLESVILLEYQNIKIFLQKVAFQIGLKDFLLLSWKCCSVYILFISDFNGEEIVGTF